VNADELVEQFLSGIGTQADQSPERLEMLRMLATRIVQLAAFDPDDGDLRVAATVLNELLTAASVFSPWREHPKLTVFGSARTKPGTPLYEMARELSRTFADRGWLTVSGAGPGIMEAAALGAGIENTLGVNITLPFEQSSNPYVDAETRLVEMKYFFTRKVALTKESIAFAIFPGGLGTMDEAFEILTLLHTGKSDPAPVVLVETLGGTYWKQWRAFIDDALIANDYVDAIDSCLFSVCYSIDEVVAAIEHFYSNYVRFETENGRGRIEARKLPSAEQLRALNDQFPQFGAGSGFSFEDARSFTFTFDGRNYVSLRMLIDVVNSWTA
jgi:uncharacterized protein (TIGR00730 family)